MHDFTPWSSLLGGGLIGLSATLLLLAAGRVAGISGIFGGLLVPTRGDIHWRALFLVGLLLAGLLAASIMPAAIGASPRSLPLVGIAGVLVGVGTRLGNGCTSGHGVCGVSRGSVRSIAATTTFMATGIATVLVMRWLGAES
jgi:uncharacterized membrane protein YedE/YeeE